MSYDHCIIDDSIYVCDDGVYVCDEGICVCDMSGVDRVCY